MTKKELLSRLEDLQMQMNQVEQMLKEKSALSKGQKTDHVKQREYNTVVSLGQDKVRIESDFALAK
ncbi:hypothetical protein [Lederbergia galactosidilytica]|uniref:Uncharacterized protein n=1 Tax=Lederbergia galactosidilytica TaxID=217031 RepID=A0A0Q9Y5L9_9BACI|nr:hypothetical protein [Lederbergia galactosidilytica]KRG16262.1 hypothetical protein ACA29_04705 [Lederbergia galactosidilytica]MBP1914599.1 hypothetical protein [Lederbergia galactosidilytica]OAK69807.1 hypothetical protein ABB05_13585 [Lederbergia galactosidilytica]